MVSVANRTRDVLATGGICLAIIASLPVLVVLGFALRPLLLAMAVIAGIACLVYGVFGASSDRSPQMRTVAPVEAKGLWLPADVMLRPDHLWARVEESDEVCVGVDDLAQAALGPVGEVDLPPRGLNIRRGEPLLRLRRGTRSVSFRAPVTGTVLGINEALRSQPRLVNEEPYAAGWVIRIRTDDLRKDRRLLLDGPRAMAWFHEEVDRLVGLARLPADMPTRQLYSRIDDEAWDRFTETVIAAPRARDEPPNDSPAGGSMEDRRRTA